VKTEGLSKKILFLLEDEIDDEFRRFLVNEFGERGKGMLSLTCTQALVQYLRRRGYLKDKKWDRYDDDDDQD
jgi:hypothetical protein